MTTFFPSSVGVAFTLHRSKHFPFNGKGVFLLQLVGISVTDSTWLERIFLLWLVIILDTFGGRKKLHRADRK